MTTTNPIIKVDEKTALEIAKSCAFYTTVKFEDRVLNKYQSHLNVRANWEAKIRNEYPNDIREICRQGKKGEIEIELCETPSINFNDNELIDGVTKGWIPAYPAELISKYIK